MSKAKSEETSVSDVQASASRLSDVELSKFLRQLSALYRSPGTGNIPLSNALSELASWVSRRASGSKVHLAKKRTGTTSSPLDLTQLKHLDMKGVEAFLADERRTKLELIDLAAVRFSIPRSQLLKLRATAVRDTIKTALMHEQSIEIISEEARRDGTKRSS